MIENRTQPFPDSVGYHPEKVRPDDNVDRLFEDRAADSPNALALTAGDLSLTYAELNHRATRLASHLQGLGIGPDVLTFLLLERSPELVVSEIAVFRAGGAYLPMDPTQPAERIRFVLEDSEARVLITTGALLERIPGLAIPGCHIVLMDEGFEDVGRALVRTPVDPENLAYVIYTSGSTGTPKGAELRQGSLSNLMTWNRGYYAIGPGERASMVASPGFDASVWEIWQALAAGASLHLPPREVVLSPSAYLEWAAAEGITIGFLPTPLAEAVVAEPIPAGLRLRVIQTGGDRLLRRPAPGVPYVLTNIYGPTETTVISTAGPVPPEGEPGGERPPHIGRPLANVEGWIVDPDFRPLSGEAEGELWIGGKGLARGYRKRPDLTAERFTPDPFGADGGRVYRTGDLVRRLSSGDLEFIGRIDFQVKIRGQRIELGEIEAALMRHPAVREAVVILQAGRLVGCVVARPEVQGDSEALRSFLGLTLPEVMLPTAWIFLDAMPLNPNGKVDRKVLAKLEPVVVEAAIAPRTPTEAAVAEIWGSELGIASVGATDDFFALGGHSLLAARMVALLRGRFGVEPTQAVIFGRTTVESLAAWIDEERLRSGASAELLPGSPGSEAAPAADARRTPLSFAQQRLWFLDRLEPGSVAYNISLRLRFTGSLRPEILGAALDEVVRRHAALRTTFEVPEGAVDPVQVVHPAERRALPGIDLTALPAQDRKPEAERLARGSASRVFDLRRGPLVRTELLRLDAADAAEHHLLATFHHSVFDGGSLEILRREVGRLYEAFAAGRPSPLAEPAMQYPDFSAWQRTWMAGGELERQLAFWRERLADPQVVELPLDRPRPSVRSHRGAIFERELPARLTEGLEQLGRARAATPFMTLLTGFLALLVRYTGQEDLLVGTPVAGRVRAEVEGLIGFFVNTLPLRVDASGEPSFSALLARVREAALAAYAHQDLPFERLVAEVTQERDLSRNPLFQMILAFLDWEPAAPIGPDLVLSAAEEVYPGTSKLDLSFHVNRTADGLHLWLEYSTALFDRDSIVRLADGFQRLLTGAVAHPDAPLTELPLLGEAERAQLAAGDQVAFRGHPTGLLHGLFEVQARRTPEAVALVAGDTVLTYAELEARSAGLAWKLKALGAGPEVAIAVCLERRAELIVTLLAVLRSGGFYVPLDPRYPEDRRSFLIEDSGARIVIDERRLADLESGDAPEETSLPAPEPENLAYLIYTSGSTGRPKAVAIRHHSAVKLAYWAREQFNPEELRGVLACTAVTFDLSVYEIFVTLAWGGAVVLVDDALALLSEPPALPAGLEITLVNTVPSAMVELLRAGALPASVRTVNLAGEALTRVLSDRVYARPETERLFNLYGPSEDTTYSTWSLVEKRSERQPSIGYPVHDTRGYVVDRRLERLPVGVPGELCLGGDGLARGYLGRPDLTAERFVPDPFATVPGERMYRTGDLARLRSDGVLDYLGRLDHQVKIRGYRIELGEIESALVQLPGVNAATVLVRNEGPAGPRLVAYVETAGELPDFRPALLRTLPEPMVPSAFVALPALPLTPHGKVDRRALSKIAPGPESRRVSGPPRTPTEVSVAAIWSELLGIEGVEGIGAADDFFSLGGHSLMATRLIALVSERLGVDLPLRVIFQESTVARLAAWIEMRHLEAPAAALTRSADRVEGPLSFAQQRLWFLDRLEPGSAAYNLPVLLRFTGRLRPEILSAALTEIVRRHAALRTTFELRAGAAEPVQRVHPAADQFVGAVDLATLPSAAREAEADRLAQAEARLPFDLGSGPLLRTTLLSLDAERHRLLSTFHHIVFDGASLEIFRTELGALAEAFAAGRPTPLPELPVQYPDFAAWQRSGLTGLELERQLSYWRDRLADARVSELPADRPRPDTWSYRGGIVEAELPAYLDEGLERLGRIQGATPFMALLAGFLTLLHRYTGEDDLLIGTPVAGRGRPELEGLIGFFINTLPIRVDLSGEPSFSDLLVRVREATLAAYAHQDLPFERLVSEVSHERDLSRNPLFQMIFAFLDGWQPQVPVGPGLTMGGAEGIHSGTAKFDLSFHVNRVLDERGTNGLHLWLEYSTDLFDRDSIVRLAGVFQSLLEGVVAHPEAPVGDLALLGVPERAQLAAGRRAKTAPAAVPHAAAVAPRTPMERAVAALWSELLGVERIGADDDFFRLGGHSLLATRLIGLVSERLGVNLSLRVIFKESTVSRLAAWIEAELLRSTPDAARPATNLAEGPLSFAQQRLWFLDRLEPGSSAYNLPILLRFAGPLRPDILAAALTEVVRRHVALRTTFELPEGATDPVQMVHPVAAQPLGTVDLGALPAGFRSPRATEADRVILTEARRPFDLQRGPLLRTTLLRLGAEEHRLLASFHHIVFDGRSLEVFRGELGILYETFSAGRPSPLPELTLQYPGFAAWQRSGLTGEEVDRQLSYWRARLAGSQVFELPADRPRPAVRTHRGDLVETVLSPGLREGLERLGRSKSATPFMVLLTSFLALLHRYTGQEDLLIGTPVAGRVRAEFDGLIGFFVNTLPLRVDVAGEPSFTSLLARVRESALAAYTYQDLPFERLVAEMTQERDPSRSPLFEVIFAFLDGWMPATPIGPGLTMDGAEGVPSGTAKFDLSFHVNRVVLAQDGQGKPTGLRLWLEYSTDLFERDSIIRLAEHFQRLLEGAVARPDAPVSALPLLGDAERLQLAAGDQTAFRGHPTGLLHGLFEAHAQLTPDAVALVAGKTVLTYAELEARSALLARKLRALGSGPEVGIAVCLERRAELIVTLLAVLRSGGFYVPLDPRYPEERRAFLIADSGAKLVIDETGPHPPAPSPGPPESPSPGEGESCVLSSNLAYLIYTSGSTGQPKAVAITHHSAVKLAYWAREQFSAEERRGVLACTAVTFDLSVYEIFVTLAWGGAVVLVDDALALLSGPPALPDGLELTLVNTVPSAMAELLRDGALPPSVRTVNLAGEALTRALADRVYQRLETERLFNLYGPSEDTTYSTWSLVERRSERQPSIGYAVHDTRAYVVDRRLERLPVGVPGELCLGGDGLARGYLGRPDLTAERFVPDPFAELPGERMYRTGDLARLRADGTLDYLGRLDHQVKIRGYRIELGEVESALAAIPGVKNASILVREDGPAGRRLVAYVEPAEPEGELPDLRQALLRTLPEPMVPSAFVVLAELPLTPHGKVDRKALARIAPAPEVIAASGRQRTPRTPTEVAVAAIWSELLGIEGIGAADDFFALGGHSLLAARLTALVQARLGVELPLRVIFREATVARLAEWIDSELLQGAAGMLALHGGLAGNPAQLSFAQQRLWFLDRLEPGSAAYNLPLPLEIAGPLRPEILAAALSGVVRRHAALRTTFELPAGATEPVQTVHPETEQALWIVDLAGLPAAQRDAEAHRLARNEARRPFNLTLLPLMRTTLLRLAADAHRLMLTMHHIVSDAWSMDVLQRELGILVDALSAGRPDPLPELALQYPDFAVWQRAWLTDAELDRQLSYWRTRLARPPVVELPTDRPRPAVWSHRGAFETAALPAALAESLERLGRRHRATPFMTLTAAILALLYRTTSQEDLVLGSPIAGRQRPEIQGLIGFFVNTLALRVHVDPAASFGALLTRVRETALEAYDHQDIPFEMLVGELAPSRDLSRNPLVQVVFALQDGLEPMKVEGDLSFAAGEWVHPGTAKFDLSLHIGRSGGEMGIWAEYATDLFDAATVRRHLDHLRRLLEGISDESGDVSGDVGDTVRVSELPWMEAAEREQVLTAWNRTAAPIPDKPVHRLFFDRALAAPDSVAVAWEGGSATYGEVARRAVELAARLRARGVGPETLVALRFERSVELVIAAVAVLEAGGAYLPIDPAHPMERAEWTVGDAGAALLLSPENLPTLLAEEAPEGLARIDQAAGFDPDSLAYVIYTSGSTGTPKGTELRHHGLSSFIAWHCRTYALTPDDKCPLLAGPGFDASVWDLWTALTSGASLHIPSREVILSPKALLAWMAETGISVLFLTTPLAEGVIAEPPPPGLALRALLTGGDRLRRRPSPALPYELINHYGPTETTIVVTAGRVEPAGERLPDIGSAVANTRTYVLDRWSQPVPVGVPGELCLAGAGLARSYRGRPELTARSFVPDPFGDGERLYRTGDVVRWLPSGRIEFLGRNDHQVKIRGNRIELGEVEVVLAGHPDVEACVAMARTSPGEAGELRLVVWAVPKSGFDLDLAGLRSYLESRLPAYMIPSAFVVLPVLPLDPNGKVDRRALPEPSAPTRADFTPPRTPIEEEVARIWREVLGVERIGVEDSFWDLGGHSILATSVLSRIEASFGAEMPLQTLFTSPTLAGFSSELAERVLEGQGDAERDEALSALDGLSEDEVRKLLEQTVRELEEMS